MRYKVEYRVPHTFEQIDRHGEVCAWLHENFGDAPSNWRFSVTWNLYFRFKRDYILFLLRWPEQKQK